VGRTTGEVELEDKVLVIRRIHVRLELAAAKEHQEVAERVHGFFAMSCPLYRTLKGSIAITTELAFVAPRGPGT
jgi:organic hydroperoxide reductase OsmC/OhrA